MQEAELRHSTADTLAVHSPGSCFSETQLRTPRWWLLMLCSLPSERAWQQGGTAMTRCSSEGLETSTPTCRRSGSWHHARFPIFLFFQASSGWQMTRTERRQAWRRLVGSRGLSLWFGPGVAGRRWKWQQLPRRGDCVRSVRRRGGDACLS